MEKFTKKHKWGVGPDIRRLVRLHTEIGFEFQLPMTSRKSNEACFWEYGGRVSGSQKSIGTVMSTANYKMPSAVLFNKSGKRPNSKQALVSMKRGYKLFVGKLFIGNHSITVKVVEADLHSTCEEEGVMFGTFIVTDVHTELSGTPAPVEQLVAKLFAEDVLRAYYANGWNTTDCSGIYRAIPEIVNENVYQSMNTLVTDLENRMTREYNMFLTGVVQVTDFSTNMMKFIPLPKDFRLRQVSYLIRDVDFSKLPCYSIDLDKAMQSLNSVIVFGCSDKRILKLLLKNGSETAYRIDTDIFVSIRGYKG